MNDREKVLTTFLVIAIVGIIAIAGALIAKDQENEKYKAIMDVACQKTYNQKQCESGVDLLMDMSPEKIRAYGSFGF